MKKDRNRWEIIMDLLRIIQEEKKAKKTRIMHKAYLDWKNFNRYLDFLKEEGFILCDYSETNTYEITENGKHLLNKLKDVGEILCIPEKNLK